VEIAIKVAVDDQHLVVILGELLRWKELFPAGVTAVGAHFKDV